MILTPCLLLGLHPVVCQRLSLSLHVFSAFALRRVSLSQASPAERANAWKWANVHAASFASLTAWIDGGAGTLVCLFCSARLLVHCLFCISFRLGVVFWCVRLYVGLSGLKQQEQMANVCSSKQPPMVMPACASSGGRHPHDWILKRKGHAPKAIVSNGWANETPGVHATGPLESPNNGLV